eukprot:gene2761-5442_t
MSENRLLEGDVTEGSSKAIFAQPVYEVYEEELQKHVDISKPNSLATNKTSALGTKICPSTATRQMPIYSVGDAVILIDPVSNLEAYGKILSEWDFRHGKAAPTIIRGDTSLVWYMVEIQGFMKDVEDYSTLSKQIDSTPPPVEYPVLYGLKSSSLRQEHELSQTVSAQVRDVRELQEFGPKMHLRASAASTESLARAAIGKAMAQEEWSTVKTAVEVSKHATKRTLVDALGVIEDKEIQRCLRVVVMPEMALHCVGDQQKLLMHEKYDKVRRVLENVFSTLLKDKLRFAVDIWKVKLLLIREVVRRKAAVRIQATCRRWLCRKELQRRWERIHGHFQLVEDGGGGGVTADQVLHFRTKKDARQYYRLLRMLTNKCVALLERGRLGLLTASIASWKAYSKAFMEEQVRRGHWDVSFSLVPEDSREVLRRDDMELKTEVVIRKLQRALDEGRTIKGNGVSVADDDYDNIASLPLALHRNACSRERDSDGNQSDQPVVPPADPSKGISLPDLIPIPASQGVGGSPVVPLDYRPKYNSYRKRMQGPTDSSCWIIPGLLLMGAAPFGKGRKKNWKDSTTTVTGLKDALSLLLLEGVGNFVSVLTPAEEQGMEMKFQCEPLRVCLQPAAVAAKKALRDAAFRLKCQRDTEQVKLDAIPYAERWQAEYASLQKDRLKRRAKVAMATAAVEQTSTELAKFPAGANWVRYSLAPDTAISRHELLPILWAVEAMLAKGERVYVYSRDGYDRAALVCGCILGRLYSLTHTETLFRLQVHLNSCSEQIGAEIPLNCPQTQSHRALLEQILKDSSRVHDPVNLRSQIDPETYVVRKATRPAAVAATKRGKPAAALVASTVPQEDYRLHRGIYEPHYGHTDSNNTEPFATGRGEEPMLIYDGGPLLNDFYVESDSLLERPNAAVKPTLPSIRRNKAIMG